MNKHEFTLRLREKLSGLPKKEVEERISFYVEMIDDRMEEGLSEEDAVRDIGSVDTIASQIISEIPLRKIVEEKIKKPREIDAFVIVLIILGFPIWFSLLAAGFAVGVALCAVYFSLIISVWSVDIALVACAVAAIPGCIIALIQGNPVAGVALIGAGFVCAGLAIIFYYLSKAVSKGALALTKVTLLGIKKLFVRKEKKHG